MQVYIGLKYEDWPYGKLLERLGGEWTHAYLLFVPPDEDWYVIEMAARGCVRVPWHEYGLGQDWCLLAHPHLTAFEKRLIQVAAEAMVGVPYGYASLPWCAWRVLRDWRALAKLATASALGLEKWGPGVSLICSEFVAKCFRLAGVPLFDDDLILPDDLWRLYQGGGLN